MIILNIIAAEKWFLLSSKETVFQVFLTYGSNWKLVIIHPPPLHYTLHYTEITFYPNLTSFYVIAFLYVPKQLV